MFLLLHLTLSEDDKDKECEEADVCIPSVSCEYYQQQLQLIQNEKQVTIKNEILTTLRRVFRIRSKPTNLHILHILQIIGLQ